MGLNSQDVCGSTDSSSMVREPKPIQLVSKELQTLFEALNGYMATTTATKRLLFFFLVYYNIGINIHNIQNQQGLIIYAKPKRKLDSCEQYFGSAWF